MDSIEKDFKNNAYLNYVESAFSKCFKNKKYEEEKPVNITSKIDPSLDFIGSSISPLKKYIINNNIPTNGVFLIQNCMKEKNLKIMKDIVHKKYGCYYKSMGFLAPVDLNKTANDLLDYLINYIAISSNDIKIKYNPEDKEFVELLKNIDYNIVKEYDPASHYTHQYGMTNEQISGRDFNIGIRKNGTNEFINCAAFVLVENPNGPIAIDMAISNCSLSMCKYGYDSTIASSRMGDLIPVNSIETERFVDSLISVAVLLKEDTLNHQLKHFKYKFKRYLNILLYWNEKYNYLEEELVDIIIKFLNMEYDDNFENEHDKWVKILKKEI